MGDEVVHPLWVRLVKLKEEKYPGEGLYCAFSFVFFSFLFFSFPFFSGWSREKGGGGLGKVQAGLAAGAGNATCQATCTAGVHTDRPQKGAYGPWNGNGGGNNKEKGGTAPSRPKPIDTSSRGSTNPSRLKEEDQQAREKYGH